MCVNNSIENTTIVDDDYSFDDTVVTIFIFIFGAFCIICCMTCCKNKKKS